jgi:hypothetical protein
MNRYTILVKADKLKQVIPIPPEFENRELEVIIKLPEKKKFNASKFKSIFNIPKDEIDHDLELMRSEWERNGK